MSRSIVAKIIPQTCQALWDVLQPQVMAVPDVAGSMKIATNFQSRWQFPHCVESIDGKYVVMQAPNNSGHSILTTKRHIALYYLLL